MKRVAQILTIAALLAACGDATRLTAPREVRGDEVVAPGGGGYGSGGVVAPGGGYGSGGNLIPAGGGVLMAGGGFGSGGFVPSDSGSTTTTAASTTCDLSRNGGGYGSGGRVDECPTAPTP